MPVSSGKKPLYIAANVGALNDMAEKKLPKVVSGQCRMYVKSAEKVLKEGKDSEMLGDEERAYVMFMKYCSIIQSVRNTPEYKKNKAYFDDIIDMKNLINSLAAAESLATSLKTRYEEKEAIEVSKKLDSLDLKVEQSNKTAEDMKIAPVDEVIRPSADKVDETYSVGAGGISCVSLYSLLQDTDTSVLILDVRVAEQFQQSHINHKSCISVPQDIIKPGTTVPHIEAALPDASLVAWKQRAHVDHIIMLDWESYVNTSLATGMVLRCLKDALYKWDSTVVIKSEPLVLEGGYEEWLLTYPTLTTNAVVPKPPSYKEVISSAQSLSNIDYDLELQFLKSKEELEQERRAKEEQERLAREAEEAKNNPPPPSPQTPTPPPPTDNHKPSHIPTVDRRQKPSAQNNNKNVHDPSSAIKSKVRIESIHNNLNNKSQSLTTNLDDLRMDLEREEQSPKPVKDTNWAEKINNNSRLPQPVPNRALKPKPAAGSQDSQEVVAASFQPKVKNKEMETGANSSSDKLAALEADIAEKEKEAEMKQKENQRLSLEHKARLSRLEKEEANLEKLRQAKSKEAKETADLMREKRKIQAEIKAIQDEKAKSELEERKKQDELLAMQREKEEEKIRVQKEAERLRQLRKEKERADKEEEQRKQTESQAIEDEIKRKRLEEQRRKEDEEVTKKRAEEDRLKRIAEDENKRKAAEEERRRRLKEEEEKKIEEESKRMGRELGSKTNDEVPVGWERRWDAKAEKLFYINHKTKSTHWELPSSITSSPKASPKHSPKPSKSTYTAKLRDEPSMGGGGGLSRSHSSPNIAKLLQDEGERKSVAPFPLPSKPKQMSQILPISTDISSAKVRNLKPTWGNVGPGLTGLRNMGNTCYMNSTMQCLCNTSPLAMYFLSDSYQRDINRDNPEGSSGHVTEEFAAIVKALWSGQYKSVTPSDFKQCIGRHNSTFSGTDQQDSQELLTTFMDVLHEDLNKVRKRHRLPDIDLDDEDPERGAVMSWNRHIVNNASIIVDLFQGQFKSTVMCQSCGKKSVTFDAFMFLSLEIPSQNRCTLRDCLLNYSKEEKMTGESRWHCPRCKVKRDATKRIVIWKLPPILIIVLKRFYYQGMWRQKMNTHVDFEIENLDMNKYISGQKTRPAYNLYAVSNHYGTMEGGHYTAYCRNPTTSRWYKFDDHEVYDISKSDIKSSAAYFLCYSSMRMEPNFVQR